MLKLKNVTQKFTKINKSNEKIKFYANNGINLEIYDKKMIGLGPNSVSKSTFLCIITAVLKNIKMRKYYLTNGRVKNNFK